MQRLTAALHPLLNENVIKLLDKHNILTIGDFLHEDANQLMRITNIGKHALNLIAILSDFFSSKFRLFEQ